MKLGSILDFLQNKREEGEREGTHVSGRAVGDSYQSWYSGSPYALLLHTPTSSITKCLKGRASFLGCNHTLVKVNSLAVQRPHSDCKIPSGAGKCYIRGSAAGR